jgi:hypothetical protein
VPTIFAWCKPDRIEFGSEVPDAKNLKNQTMSLTADRSNLESQLQLAKETLDEWVKTLDAKGVTKEARRRDPKWRHLRAKCNTLNKRLRRVNEIAALDEDVKRRKAEKLAGGGEAGEE